MPATGTGAGQTGPTVFNGLGDGATTAPKPTGNAAPNAVQFGNAYGLAVVVAGLFAGFAVML